MSDSPDNPRTLADRVNALFEDIKPPGRNGRPYTNAEVAAAIRQENPAIAVSSAYLSQIRTGAKRNPNAELLKALAAFFGVQPSYMFDDATASRTAAEIALAKVMANNGVRALALRAAELTPEGLAAVTRIVEDVLALGRERDKDPPAKPPNA